MERTARKCSEDPCQAVGKNRFDIHTPDTMMDRKLSITISMKILLAVVVVTAWLRSQPALAFRALPPTTSLVARLRAGRVPKAFYKVNGVADQWDSTHSDDESPFGVDHREVEEGPHRWGQVNGQAKKPAPTLQDPAALEIEDSTAYEPTTMQMDELEKSGHYPVSIMMQDCAPFIAAHAGETVVFHLPGDLLEDSEKSKSLLGDIVIAYLLGMKIVIVVGTRADSDGCSLDFSRPHECQNSLKVVNEESLRHLEEEAGYLRTEIERKSNRCMHMQGSMHVEGNIVSGNFYTARRYGRIRGQDFQYAGYVGEVHTDNIEKVLRDNDIVLLSTVGLCSWGDLVNVNGYHLAASVASSLKAYKLVYMANEGSIFHKKGGGPDDIVQELPLSFAEEILDFHNIKVHSKGFAHFDEARGYLDPRGVELLLHLGWASWALEHGVKRAHIVNPTDGGLLEELFTTKNGANTCLFNDDELKPSEDDIDDAEWDNFFHGSKAPKKGFVASFG